MARRSRKLDLVNRRDVWMDRASSAPAQSYLEDTDLTRTNPHFLEAELKAMQMSYPGLRNDGRSRFKEHSVNHASLIEYQPKIGTTGNMVTTQGWINQNKINYSASMGSTLPRFQGHDKNLNPVTKAEEGGRGYIPSFCSPSFDNLVDRVYDVGYTDITRRINRGEVNGATAPFHSTSKRPSPGQSNGVPTGPGDYQVESFKEYMNNSKERTPALYRSERTIHQETWMPETVGPGSYGDAHHQHLAVKYTSSPSYSFSKSQHHLEKTPWVKKMGPNLGPWSEYNRAPWKKSVYLSTAPKTLAAKEYHNVTTDTVFVDQGSIAANIKNSPNMYGSSFKTIRKTSETLRVPYNCDGPGTFEVPKTLTVHVSEPEKPSDFFHRKDRNTDVVVYGSNWKTLRPRYEISEQIWNEHMKGEKRLETDQTPERQRKQILEKTGNSKYGKSRRRQGQENSKT